MWVVIQSKYLVLSVEEFKVKWKDGIRIIFPPRCRLLSRYDKILPRPRPRASPPCLQAPPPVVSSDAHIGGAKLYESKQEMKPAHKAVVTPRTTQGMESIRLTIKPPILQTQTLQTPI